MSRKKRGSFVKLESSTGWEYKFTSRETLNEAYKRYKTKHDEAEARMEERGREMYSPRLNRRDFEDRYVATANDERALYKTAEEYKKHRTRDIIGKIVEEQRFRLSYKEGRDVLRTINKLDLQGFGTQDINKARALDFWNNLDKAQEEKVFKHLGAEYHRYKSSGASSAEAAWLISREYFGS